MKFNIEVMCSTKGSFWSVGGAGVYWPDRHVDSLGKEESSIAESREVRGGTCMFDTGAPSHQHGSMLWCPFNSKLNSSTRCELGATLLAMVAPVAAHLGVDNATVVLKGTQIIQHLRKRISVIRHTAAGIMILGDGLHTCINHLHTSPGGH